jgi:hypothetical protein
MRLTFDPRLSGTYLETIISVLRVYTRFIKSAARPTFDPMNLWISWFDPQAKATFSGSDCIVPQHWGIRITGCIKLRDEVDIWSQTQWNLFGNQYLCFASLYPIHEKCRAAHFWSHALVDLMVCSPREGHIFGIRLFCAPTLGDQNYGMYKTQGWGWLLIPDSVEFIWKPISLFCEFIHDSWKVPRSPILIPWSCESHGLIPKRRPYVRDKIVLCPSIGGWKLQDV